jgi:hypothetical protein
MLNRQEISPRAHDPAASVADYLHMRFLVLVVLTF